MAPGVPDTYQGTELWDLSLVDPDNRRPVDYEARERLLREPLDGLNRWECGAAKLNIVSRLLRFRRENPDLFAHGEYLPLEATGPAADHVFAFYRRHGDRAVIVAVPRLTAKLANAGERWPTGTEVWGDTALSLLPETAEPWTNLLSGESVAGCDGRLPAAAAFGSFSVAVITT